MIKGTSNSSLIFKVLFIIGILSIMGCTSSTEDDLPESMVEEPIEEEDSSESESEDTSDDSETKVLSNITIISESEFGPLIFNQIDLNPTEDSATTEELIDFGDAGAGVVRVVDNNVYAHNRGVASFVRKNLQTDDSQVFSGYFDHTIGESLILNVANTTNFNITLFNDFDVQSLGHLNILNTQTLTTVDIQISEPNGLFGISGEDRLVARDNFVLVADPRRLNLPPGSERVYDIRVLDLNTLSEVAIIQNVVTSLYTLYDGKLLRVNPNNRSYTMLSIPALEVLESGSINQIPASESALFSYEKVSEHGIAYPSRGFGDSKYLSFHNFNSGQSQLLWDPIVDGHTNVGTAVAAEFGLTVVEYDDVFYDAENNILIVEGRIRKTVDQEVIRQDIVMYVDNANKDFLYHKVLNPGERISSIILRNN